MEYGGPCPQGVQRKSRLLPHQEFQGKSMGLVKSPRGLAVREEIARNRPTRSLGAAPRKCFWSGALSVGIAGAKSIMPSTPQCHHFIEEGAHAVRGPATVVITWCLSSREKPCFSASRDSPPIASRSKSAFAAERKKVVVCSFSARQCERKMVRYFAGLEEVQLFLSARQGRWCKE